MHSHQLLHDAVLGPFTHMQTLGAPLGSWPHRAMSSNLSTSASLFPAQAGPSLRARSSEGEG